MFQTAEQLLKKKQEAADKLREYEEAKGVGVKKFLVYAVAISCVFSAYIGMHFDQNILLWTGVVLTIASVTLGEKWIRAAKKQALEQFKKDPNRHLAEYLPS